MKVLLRLSPKMSKEPVIAEVILKTGAKINIDRANVGAVGGETVLDVPDDKSDRVIALFKSKGIETILLPKPIIIDRDRCVHCGACISVCPNDVFRFVDWQLVLEEEKCSQCGTCVISCPLGALSLAE